MTGRATFMEDIDGLDWLTRRQHDVVSRTQLRRLGVTPQHVAHQVRACRWRLLSRDVVVLHRGPLTRRGEMWAALLGASDRAVLGAWSALELHGLSGWSRDAVHLVLPRGDKCDRFPWLTVHESRRLGADVVGVDGLRVHTAARSAIDAAAWQPSVRTAAGLMAAVVQQGLATPDGLLGTLETVGKVRHRRAMQLALLDIGGGADSLAEIDFARLCRAADLPEPTRQSARIDARGRRRFLDVEWRLAGGGRLVVEIDGVGHLERERWYDDLMRDAEIGADARTIRIRLPATAARHEPELVLAVVRRHLQALGWQAILRAA
jgi:hypothetical protein